MAIKAFAPGDVILYPYRWLREQAAGRSQDGAKERPCCVVLAVADAKGEAVLGGQFQTARPQAGRP